MRAFLAVELPAGIHEKAAGFKRECESIQRGAVRYVNDSNLHVTLKFLGEIDEKQRKALTDALAAVRIPSGPVRIAGTGTFPPLPNPNARVVWIGVKQDAANRLTRLFEAVETACADCGIPRDERGFSPHLTVARVKGRLEKALLEFLRTQSSRDFGEFVPDEFCLFESTLTPDGPVYEKLAGFPINDPEQ